ncbi:MAG TPA: restriction endonuclease [Mucilaginibacter sp.]
MKEWRVFERLVAILSSDEYDDSYTIIPNAKIKGFISGRKRQIDVLIEFRFNSDLSKRIIIDAKKRKRPIDIKEVESFEGMMKDVNAQRGFIVCSNGHTKAAKNRAQEHIGIRLIPQEEIEDFDLTNWDQCLNEKCIKGLILWDSHPGLIIDGKVTIHSTGKCDECGAFHVYCQGCGNKKALKVKDDWQCECEGSWFWLTSTELEDREADYAHKANYLILVFGDGYYEIMDRRPL